MPALIENELTTDLEVQHQDTIGILAQCVEGSMGIPLRVYDKYKKHPQGVGSPMLYTDFTFLIQNSPYLRSLIDLQREEMLDTAEDVIAKALKGEALENPGQLKIAQWYLKEQGRSRGYVDGKKAVAAPAPQGIPPVQINFVAAGETDTLPRPPGRPQKRPALDSIQVVK